MRIPLRSYLNLLNRYLASQRAAVAGLLTLVLTGIGLQVYSPQILRQFIDLAIAGRSLERLPALAALFIGLAFVQQALGVISRYLSENIGWTATNDLRADLALHCLRLDMAFHKDHAPGELVERIDGDINQLATFFSRLVVDLLGNLVLVIGVLAMLFREDWRAGGATTAFTLFALVFLLAIRNIAVPHFAAVRQQTALFFGFLGERLAGREDIRANGAAAHTMARFHAMLGGWFRRARLAYVTSVSMWMASLLAFNGADAMAFVIAAYLWRRHLTTIGSVYLIFNYIELVCQPVARIRTQLQDLQKASAAIVRITGLLAVQPAIVEGRSEPLPEGALSVEFRGVTFGYEEDGEIFRGINLSLAAGRTLGLLGRTGSGKSSLIRLILRLYDPQAGEVRLGGVPLCDVALTDLRQRVAVVTQDVQLFRATVRDNLTLFSPHVDDKRIISALRELGLSDWLDSLERGLDTELMGGQGVSAGQAQLLSFARVFLTNPGLIILDEASSRVDPATEALIQRAVAKLLEGRTAIIIAHHLATVQRADEILILDDGAVVERGDRLRLAADPDSRFSRLLNAGLEEVLA